MGIVVIGAVAVLVWLAFREEPWARALLKNASVSLDGHVKRDDKRLVTRDELLGDAAYSLSIVPPGSIPGRSVHRSTWTARLLAPVLSVVFLVAIVKLAAFLQPGQVDAFKRGLPMVGAIFVYGVLFVWAFRVEIVGDTLRVMSPMFFMRSFLLAEVERVQEDGAMAWRVFFADGRKPQVLKAVVEADTLRHRLADAVTANERG